MASSTTNNGRPVLDEDSFQKLLAAAYVLQEHNEQQRIVEPALPLESAEVVAEQTLERSEINANSTQILVEIVECQHQIQVHHLDPKASIELIAERAQQITHADGAAVGLVEQENLVYWAGTGSATRLTGTRVKMAFCLAADCVNAGTTLQCPDIRNDIRLDHEICRWQGINAVIAVPIFYDGKPAGCVELHFANPNSYHEHDVRTCQLMAGLVSEALAGKTELELQQISAAGRAPTIGTSQEFKLPSELLADKPEALVSQTDAYCAECGSTIDADQIFCGFCGAQTNQESSGDIQSKWASMWRISQAKNLQANAVPEEQPESFVTRPLLGGTPDSDQRELPSVDDGSNSPASSTSAEKSLSADYDNAPRDTTSRQQPYPWTSAARSRAWLESLNGMPSNRAIARFWKNRRADVYLVIAVVLVVMAIGWGIWSNDSGSGVTVTASSRDNSAASRVGSRRARVQEPKLSLTDRLLVSLGLAEPPPAPVYSGNPETKVWVDLHTALYYCPDADLYGKTPRGKFTNQRDAQLDQFEPAYRKACD
jgi:hypothetical protein